MPIAATSAASPTSSSTSARCSRVTARRSGATTTRSPRRGRRTCSCAPPRTSCGPRTRSRCGANPSTRGRRATSSGPPSRSARRSSSAGPSAAGAASRGVATSRTTRPCGCSPRRSSPSSADPESPISHGRHALGERDSGMGDLGTDTTVTPNGEGAYQAHLSREWEIWGPMGGYVASVALRAAGAASRFDRPASFSCHYLGVADFDVVDIAVEPLRQAKAAESLRVSITQVDRRILDAQVWATGDVEGLEHTHVAPPDVPDPSELKSIPELVGDDAEGPPFPFWNNLDPRPVQWNVDWPPPGPSDPIWQQWEKFVPTATFDDPWVDAARSVILVDVASWPAASQHHAWKQAPFIAPTLDLYVAFHEPVPESEYLLADGHSPVGRDGLLGFTTRVWSEDRRLVASGGGQMLCRRMTPPS